MNETHWRALERMYVKAPINAFYQPVIRIGDRTCEIEVTARDEFNHAAHAVHGSVYFKMLDDAGFFAAGSIVEDVFVLTSNFTIHLLRPVASGVLLAKARVVYAGATQFVCDADLYNEGKLVAHGVGTYVRSKFPWPQ